MPKRILLIAATTGYQTRAFTAAAQELGFAVRLATDRCHRLDDPWRDNAIPVRFENPDASAEALAEEGAFDGVVAVGDRPLPIAARYARRAGLPFHSPEAVEIARNKNLARQRLREAGLPTPAFHRIGLDCDPGAESVRAPFPCVLKPLGLSGSRGVVRADSRAEFVTAFRRIGAILNRPEIRRYRDEQDRFLQVESYIPGREFAIDGLVTNGQFRPVAIFEKPDPLEGPFFEESIYLTPPRIPAEERAAIAEATERAVQALGLSQGPIHAELRLNEHGAYMLEVAARPIGGLCARCLRFQDGQTLEHIVLRHAAGEDVSAASLVDAAAGVMMIPTPAQGIYAGVDGLDRVRAVPGIWDAVITAKEGQLFERLPEGQAYLGFLFAAGEDSSEVDRSLRAAHGCLRFRWATVLPRVG